MGELAGCGIRDRVTFVNDWPSSIPSLATSLSFSGVLR